MVKAKRGSKKEYIYHNITKIARIGAAVCGYLNASGRIASVLVVGEERQR